ncbi:hypothetical protein HMPREF9171_2161 [Streptococcus agalactiae ATCC 13813]|nr:hypothetical protein HMPREF9171_2161 [Streptococcus agalactiae ATCC 13813]
MIEKTLIITIIKEIVEKLRYIRSHAVFLTMYIKNVNMVRM